MLQTNGFGIKCVYVGVWGGGLGKTRIAVS